MQRVQEKTLRLLTRPGGRKWSLAAKSLLAGLAAGLLAATYRLLIEYGTDAAKKIYGFLAAHPLWLPLWLAGAVLAGLALAALLRWEPMATGSGIPQVEGMLLYGMKMRWAAILAVRFVAGGLSSLFGLSLGREGPSIQIGASAAQGVSKAVRRDKLEANYLITGGAAAGLSAAFNAPLSGMVFALEEVHRSFSPLILLAATAASLTADAVSKLFFGLKPVLGFLTLPQLPQRYYLWMIPLGLAAGLAGSLINKGLLGFQTLYGRLPWFLRPAAALLLALPVGLFLPAALGGGQNLIALAEEPNRGVLALLFLCGVKFLFTCTSFGSGVPGGIFMPILSVGALTGGAFGLLLVQAGMDARYVPAFAVCAMAGALSSSVKAPVTSILLTAEMTGSLVHLLPVAACSLMALLVSDLLKVTPIYEALLERIAGKAGVMPVTARPGALVETPVELGSAVAGRTVRDVEWPRGLLIVSIRRGEQDIVPRGDTVVLPGDYLAAMTSEQSYAETAPALRALCRPEADEPT